LYLKFVLMKIETEQPEFFKEVMASLNETQVGNLLLAIKHSEEYIQKLKDEIARQAAQ
jgi:hypothetical protein